MKLSLIRTDHVQCYHLHVDTEAAQFTAMRIELFPHAPLVVGDATMTQEDLWREAMASLRWLRTQPGQSLYPSTVFVPFAKIIAVDRDAEAREQSIHTRQIIGDYHPDHEERVRALCAALDLLDGAPLPASVGWN